MQERNAAQSSTSQRNLSRERRIPATPVAGFRIPAIGSLKLASFPVLEMCGPAFADSDGNPVYVCSAILGSSVHPGKAGPHYMPPVRFSLAGKEVVHEGRYDLLPITDEMKWVQASHGNLPEGYSVVQGGYEESSEQLFHAVAKLDDVWVPGKTGIHLSGAHFAFKGEEIVLLDDYRVLCWKKETPRADKPRSPTSTTQKSNSYP